MFFAIDFTNFIGWKTQRKSRRENIISKRRNCL